MSKTVKFCLAYDRICEVTGTFILCKEIKWHLPLLTSRKEPSSKKKNIKEGATLNLFGYLTLKNVTTIIYSSYSNILFWVICSDHHLSFMERKDNKMFRQQKIDVSSLRSSPTKLQTFILVLQIFILKNLPPPTTLHLNSSKWRTIFYTSYMKNHLKKKIKNLHFICPL